MSLLQKRTTLTQNIAYMAIMAAINIIFSLIASFVPIIGYFLMLVLPLTSVIVTLYCQKKYYFIYMLATIGLSFAITAWNLTYTIYYVIPSMLTGFLFAILIKNKINGVYIILLTSILQTIISLLFIPLINFLLSTDVILQFLTLMSLQNSTSISTIVPSFIFFISLCQMIFTYTIIHDEITKFGYEISEDKFGTFLLPLGTILCLAIVAIFSMFLLSISYLFLMISIYLCLFMVITHLQSKNKLISFLNLVALLISFIVFGVFYSLLDGEIGLLLIGVFPLLTSLIIIFNNLLRLKTHKDRIEARGKN